MLKLIYKTLYIEYFLFISHINTIYRCLKTISGGYFPGNGAQRQKKRLPRRIKNGAACRETPRRASAETHPASAAPARRPPRVHSYPRGTARRKRYGPFPTRFEGHSSVCGRNQGRQNGIPRTDSRQAGSGRETCPHVGSGHTPRAPPSGADFKTESNVPTSSGYPTAELRIGGLSKMPERCCCPKRCACQGFAHLLANPDSAK